MPSSVSIVVADATRMPVIRQRLRVPGNAMHVSASNLPSAIDNIRSYQPNLIAVDLQFAQTPAGRAFVERVEKVATAGSEIRLITTVDGQWVTIPREVSSAAAAKPVEVVAPARKSVVAEAAVLNTRRAPRFMLRDLVNAVVENGSATLVDISVLGAQVMSQPALRPNQTIKIVLPDSSETLQVTARVAWSAFEKPQPLSDAYYRAGIAFTDAAQQVLENYRRRYCADDPIPNR